jgi:hypothetical protein
LVENGENKKFLGEVTTPISLQKNKGGGGSLQGVCNVFCCIIAVCGLHYTYNIKFVFVYIVVARQSWT